VACYPRKDARHKRLIIECVCENVCGDECAYGGGDDWIVGGYAGDDCECVYHVVSPRIIRLEHVTVFQVEQVLVNFQQTLATGGRQWFAAVAVTPYIYARGTLADDVDCRTGSGSTRQILSCQVSRWLIAASPVHFWATFRSLLGSCAWTVSRALKIAFQCQGGLVRRIGV